MYRRAVLTVGALLVVLLVGLAFSLGFVTNDNSGGGSSSAAQDTPRDIDGDIDGDIDFRTLDQIIDILLNDHLRRDDFQDDLFLSDLYEGAIEGLLDVIADSGTFYIDARTFQLDTGSSGRFEGIGATVQEQGSDVIIVRPFEGSPAEAAGILPGDVIVAVDGELAQGWSVDKVVLRIRGPEGTQVVIAVRHLDGVEEELTITRAEIEVDSVTTTPPGGVLRDAEGEEATEFGYLYIGGFTERTPLEVEAAVIAFDEAGKEALIIDVRGNPGGLLQETVDTADIFLDEGMIILIEIDREEREEIHRSRPGGAGLDFPIVILQDENSASGAEVLAAALRDNGRATVIGAPSFGKGTVNFSQPLNDGGALFVTIRRWLTPNGVQIDGVGITPDVEAGPGPLDPLYDATADAQIIRAIEHLRSLSASGSPVPSSVAP